MIESPHSGVRLRTRQVCRWRDGKMVLRWAAAALLMTEKNFRRIMGYKDLWMLSGTGSKSGIAEGESSVIWVRPVAQALTDFETPPFAHDGSVVRADRNGGYPICLCAPLIRYCIPASWVGTLVR